MMERTRGEEAFEEIKSAIVTSVTGGIGTSVTSHRRRRQTNDETLICFSHLSWDFVFQRPGHLLSRAAQSRRVLYVEEPHLDEDARSRAYLERIELPSGVERLIPHLPKRMSPAERNLSLRTLLERRLAHDTSAARIGWYYTPMALAFSGHLEFDLCVYDCMDELAAFKGAPENLKHEENRLLSRADIVFTGGISLFEAKSKRHPHVHLFPSSVDEVHFAPARRPGTQEPADLACIPHPRIGYFGVIDERLDYDLLDALALARPDWHVVMIGPQAKIDPRDLPRRPNLHWLGGKPYAALPAYLKGFDAGFMPFAMNEATRFISPTSSTPTPSASFHISPASPPGAPTSIACSRALRESSSPSRSISTPSTASMASTSTNGASKPSSQHAASTSTIQERAKM